tara:strand:+ start:210 stop:839 length:630 start_codon:yes stop_codon:yes gene_type:complete
MIKQKPCRGQSKAKGHGCGKLVDVEKYGKTNRKYGLGLDCKCYSTWLLTTDEGKSQLERETIKAKQPTIELEKAKAEKKGRTGLAHEIKLTQNVFNKYVRIRDKGKDCISELTPWKPDFDCGHYFTVKNYTGLRFHEDNAHGQSILGNRYKYGNFDEYTINLPKRIGQDRFNQLKQLAEDQKRNGFKWNIEDVKEIRKEYLLKIKQLEK